MAITADDVISMDVEELKRSSEDLDVDADELDFPEFAHHMTVSAKLRYLAQNDAISEEEYRSLYESCKE